MTTKQWIFVSRLSSKGLKIIKDMTNICKMLIFRWLLSFKSKKRYKTLCERAHDVPEDADVIVWHYLKGIHRVKRLAYHKHLFVAQYCKNKCFVFEVGESCLAVHAYSLVQKMTKNITADQWFLFGNVHEELSYLLFRPWG